MINRLPAWFRQEIPDKGVLSKLKLLKNYKVNTVCKSAHCPNLSDCFKYSKFTFMILGDTCTRSCRFCAVKKNKKDIILPDTEEPNRIAKLVSELGVKFVVITSVTRDDLPDGGAEIFAKTIEQIHNLGSDIKVEVLIPDFLGKFASLKTIADASPEVVGHNIETVNRFYKDLRPQADYRRSLDVLAQMKKISPEVTTKSSFMLGFGETADEVIGVMKDLREVNCDILTIGQYLSPSKKHFPVKEFISLERFKEYNDIGIILGFKAVLSGPKVRSSYNAEQAFSLAREG